MYGGNFAHRRTTLTELNVKSLRERTGLTHADFSQMICVGIWTLGSELLDCSRMQG